MLNMTEYAGTYLKKQSAEYTGILNWSDVDQIAFVSPKVRIQQNKTNIQKLQIIKYTYTNKYYQIFTFLN